jgi:hypothetical protein
VVQAPGGCRLAGAAYLRLTAINLHPAPDGKTAAQSEIVGSRLPAIGELEPIPKKHLERFRRRVRQVPGSSAALAAAGLALSTPLATGATPITIVMAVVGVLLMILAAIRYRVERAALPAGGPRASLGFGDLEISAPGQKGSVVLVPVVNDPGDSPVRADGVYATLRIDRPDGSPLIADVEGVWSDTPDPEISIEPNGRPRYIDTVTQEANGMLYVWTERGRGVKQVWGMLDQQSQIGDQQCVVHVTVRGSNIAPITKSFPVAPGISRPKLLAAKDPRRQERLALADEAEQHAASLTGFCEEWSGRISGHERWPGSPDHSSDRTYVATGKMMREYQEQHRVKVSAVFDRLVDEGVTDTKYRPDIRKPAHPGIVCSIPDLLDSAVARLRVSDKGLADYLAEQFAAIQSLRTTADATIQPGEATRERSQRYERLWEAFWNVYGEVVNRLLRDAPAWASYLNLDRGMARYDTDDASTNSALKTLVVVMDEARNQIGHVKGQVG